MILPSDITKPCKHGFIIDLTDGERRVQVRVFEFETQRMPGGAGNAEGGVRNAEWCEMPVSIDEGQAIARLRQAMECLRETALARGMTKPETRMRNDESMTNSSFAIPHSSLPAELVLGDIECCEKEGGIAP